jgi:group I intron endonuclease
MIVYCAFNKINGKRYIGITKRKLSVRLSAHLRSNSTPFQKALRLYGIQSFEIAIIDTAETWAILCEKERYWISCYSCTAPEGYNLTSGGDGLNNPCAETRRKMSLAGMGRKRTTEHTEKLLASVRGRKHTEEERGKISRSKIGKTRSPETIKKMSEANLGKPSPMKGKKHTPESIAKFSASLRGKVPWNKGIKGSKGYWKGKTFSEEHRKNLSLAKRKMSTDTPELWVN